MMRQHPPDDRAGTRSVGAGRTAGSLGGGQTSPVDWSAVFEELSRAIETGSAVQLPDEQMPPDFEAVARSLLSRLDDRITDTAAQIADFDDERARITSLRRAADPVSEPRLDSVNVAL